MGTSWAELRTLAPRSRSRRLYPNDSEYEIEVEIPGKASFITYRMASSGDEAGELVAESLMETECVDFDTASSWISPAQRVRRGA